MKATTPGFLVILSLVCFRVDTGNCQRSLQSVPFTGIGSVRPLRDTSSFFSPLPPHSVFNESEPGDGWVPSMNSSSSSNASSSANDVGGPSANSSQSSSSSTVLAFEAFANTSAGGVSGPESTNSSALVNLTAVEKELIETLEVDQQVTGEGWSCSFMKGLLHVATRCYTLLHVATRCYTLLHVATRCYALLHAAHADTWCHS